jgi:hypothetical protein
MTAIKTYDIEAILMLLHVEYLNVTGLQTIKNGHFLLSLYFHREAHSSING